MTAASQRRPLFRVALGSDVVAADRTKHLLRRRQIQSIAAKEPSTCIAPRSALAICSGLVRASEGLKIACARVSFGPTPTPWPFSVTGGLDQYLPLITFVRFGSTSPKAAVRTTPAHPFPLPANLLW